MMAVEVRPRGHVRAPSGCRHQQPATGGRCAFPSGRRPDGLCGREAVAVYVNPAAAVRSTYRCAVHDRDVAVEAAAAQGFTRIAVRS